MESKIVRELEIKRERDNDKDMGRKRQSERLIG